MTVAAPGALRALRQFARPTASSAERCELCARDIAERHEHLVDLEDRRLVCSCAPCAWRFEGPGASLVRVPPRAEPVDLSVGEADWRGLGIPVAVAFFVRSSRTGEMVVVFPGPAGATEAPLDEARWAGLVARHPGVPALVPDVEALLVSRLDAAPGAFLVSVDRCYHLTGLLRRSWRGFAGGEQAWAEVASFFSSLGRAGGA
jgi:hypothetical protein